MIPVTIERRIHSAVPGRAGNWALIHHRWLHAVPSPGDEVELADGWCCESVDRVTYAADGEIIVCLRPVKTDSPAILREQEKLISEHGWEMSGGPWPQQL
jgi:hypothetical protein